MGTESLPQGIISKTSNLETQHLWNYDDNEKVVQVNFVTIFTPSYYYYYFCSLLFCCCVPFLCLFQGSPNHRGMSLLAMAVGIKQKELVNKLIQKVLSLSFFLS